MLKRRSFYFLIGLGSFYLMSLMLDKRFDSPSLHQIPPTAAVPDTKQKKIAPKAQSASIQKPVEVLLLPDTASVKKKPKRASLEKNLEQTISARRKLISIDMKDYKYSDGKYNISASKLEDLVVEKNGTPIRSLIVTTWRSGSTFLGDILNAHPANYYHYEPPLAFDIVQVRGPPLAAKVLKLAVRMVLLVRDPRGILQSRKHRDLCPPSPDCSDPALTCADLVSDYKVAVELLKKYPNRFKVIRYEDLSLDPYKHVEELYKFYGLNLHPKTRKFLESHTKAIKGGVSSTFRNSVTAPFHWRTDLEFEEVEEIQESCATAMKYWGYVPAINATHRKKFNPVTNYVLKT